MSDNKRLDIAAGILAGLAANNDILRSTAEDRANLALALADALIAADAQSKPIPAAPAGGQVKRTERTDQTDRMGRRPGRVVNGRNG